MWTRQDSNLQIRACHGVLSIKLLALKIHLFSRTDVVFFLLLLTYFLFMFNMEILKGHRTDSNHRTRFAVVCFSLLNYDAQYVVVSYVRNHIFESHAY